MYNSVIWPKQDIAQSLELLQKKKREFLGRSGGMLPRKILKVKTKICAIWSILEAVLKKSNTLKIIMNISFLPSICIHRSIILIFIEKSMLVNFFPPWKKIFLWFSIFISARILVSMINSRRWEMCMFIGMLSDEKPAHTVLLDCDNFYLSIQSLVWQDSQSGRKIRVLCEIAISPLAFIGARSTLPSLLSLLSFSISVTASLA